MSQRGVGSELRISPWPLAAQQRVEPTAMAPIIGIYWTISPN